jgi:hypothetical protein
MSVAEFFVDLHRQVGRRAYIIRLEVIEQSVTLLKARLYISPDLFVQVYRNDRFDTTNLVLIHNGQRIYGRDQLGGAWHRHTATTPDLHDTSAEGQMPVDLSEFLNEVEAVLGTLGLP